MALLTACRGTLAWVDRDGGVCDREDGGANGGDGRGGTFPEKAGTNRRVIGWMDGPMVVHFDCVAVIRLSVRITLTPTFLKDVSAITTY